MGGKEPSLLQLATGEQCPHKDCSYLSDALHNFKLTFRPFNPLAGFDPIIDLSQ